MAGKIFSQFVSKSGRDVVFRYPRREDFNAVWKFACELTDEDTFVELAGQAPTKEEEKRWFGSVLDGVTKGERIYLSVVVDGVYAGNGEVRRGKYRRSHVGDVSLSLASAYRNEGIGTKLLQALIDESVRVGLRLLTLSCFENNPRALHVYRKVGFETLGILPKAIAFQGSFVGEVKLFLPL